MLSTENPPDPICSCKISGLKGDERADDHEELAFLQGAADLVKPAGLEETQQSQFSIRDYVFTARSKDIGDNWPFPQRLLQVCLKHCIKGLLPPFEPPHVVRDKCCKKAVRSDHHACPDSEKDIVEADLFEQEDANLLDLQDSYTKSKPFQPSDRSILEFLDQGDKKLCGLSKSLGSKEVGGLGDLVSTLTTHVETDSNSVPAGRLTPSLHEANSISEALVEFEALEPPFPSNRTGVLVGPSDKKCQLIVNLVAVSESSQPEERILNSSALTEPMASKVCPVCKTFASTSNTTLNAHIDQCLATESTCKEVLTDKTKCGVKPRKKRLMVDIYATAPCCTLEDLDRRNGRSWPIGSITSMTNDETCMGSKRQRMDQVDFTDDGEDEREVYVDSNGTKLRILSKFNDKVAATIGDDSTRRNDLKLKAAKILSGKKKRLGQKCSNLLKIKPQSKKILRPYNGKIPNELNEEYQMERPLPHLLEEAQNPMKIAGSGTWRQWACSKRSSISKKSSNGDRRGLTGDRSLIKSSLSTSGNSSAKRSHVLKFSRFSENAAGPLRSKRQEILSNDIDFSERSSLIPHGNNLGHLIEGCSIAGGCVVKLPKSSGCYAASPRSKRVEVKAGTTRRSPNMPERRQFSLKVKKSSTLRDDILFEKPSHPLEPSKNSEKRKGLSFKMTQKCACMAEMTEGLPSDIDVGYDQIHDSIEISGASSLNQNKMHHAHKLNCLEDMMASEIAAVTDGVSTEGDDPFESEQEDVSTSEEEENLISERLHFPVEYRYPAMESGYLEDGCNFDRYDKSEDQESAAGEVAEEVSGDNIVSYGETHSFDGNASAIHTNPQSLNPEEDHVGRVCLAKLQVDLTTLRSCDDQEMNYVKGDSDNAQLGTKIEAGSFTEADLTPTQRLVTTSLSHGDTGYEVQENSSVTSSRPHFSQDEHQRVNRDRSGSPVSATSAMSPMSRSNFKCSQLEAQSMGPEIQDKVSVSFSVTTAEAILTDAPNFLDSVPPSLPRMEGPQKAKLDKENLEVMITGVNDQPCCCSMNTSISEGATLSYQQLQFLHSKGLVETLALPPKCQQETTFNSNARAEICSSFSSANGSDVDGVVIPPMDSPGGSILSRASSNATMKLQTCRDFGLGSPSSQTLTSPASSTCSSIRLMGKDLIVIRDDDDDSSLPITPLAGDESTCSLNGHSNSKYPTLIEFSRRNVPNQVLSSFGHPCPDVGGSDPFYPLKNFDVYSGKLSSKVALQSPLQLPIDHMDMITAGFVGSAMQQGSKGRSEEQSQQKTLDKRPNFPFSHNVDGSAHDQGWKPVYASQAAKPMSEVLVVDDSPEQGRPSSHSVDAKYSVGSIGIHPLPMGISPLTVSDFNPRRPMNVYSCFPPSSTFSTELLSGSKPSFLMSRPGENASSSKQGGCVAEGLGILSTVPSVLPSPSTGYLNSTNYYCPRLRLANG